MDMYYLLLLYNDIGEVCMNEERKKISLLTNLYDILFNNFVNNNIFDYKFYSISNLILNGINFNVSSKLLEEWHDKKLYF